MFKLLFIAIILFCAWFLNFVSQKICKKICKETSLTVKHTFAISLVHVGIVATTMVLIVLQFTESGKELRNLFVSGGVAAIVLGLAAQSSLNNVFCGFTILSSHPFEIGDRIQIGTDTQAGYVKKLTLQTTILQTYTGEEISVPNSIVASARITNYTHINGFSYPLEITVAYDTDLEKAKQIISDVLSNNKNWYGDKPCVLVKEAGDFGIKLKVLVTTKLPDCNPQVCSDCLEQILAEFAMQKISVPYPTYTIHK